MIHMKNFWNLFKILNFQRIFHFIAVGEPAATIPAWLRNCDFSIMVPNDFLGMHAWIYDFFSFSSAMTSNWKYLLLFTWIIAALTFYSNRACEVYFNFLRFCCNRLRSSIWLLRIATTQPIFFIPSNFQLSVNGIANSQ